MLEIPTSPPCEQIKTLQPEKEPRRLLRRLGRIATIGLIAAGGIINLYGDSKRSDKVSLFHEDNQQVLGDSMTIMTANVHSWEGLNGNNFNKFRKAVEKEDPDVICMQEVLSNGDELKELYEMGYDVFFHATRDLPLMSSQGNAVASKAPMHNISTVNLPSSRILIPRNAIRFNIDTENGELAFSNMHLDTENSGSDQQIKFFSLKYGKSNDFSCGDYNKTREAILAGPMGVMIDNSSEFAAYNTFPSHKPVRGIDHILTTCGILLSSEVVDIDSDHLALSETHYIADC